MNMKLVRKCMSRLLIVHIMSLHLLLIALSGELDS